MTISIDPQTANDANTILQVLVEKMEKVPVGTNTNTYVVDILLQQLTDSEFQRSSKLIATEKIKRDLDNLAGVVIGGTGIIKDEAGIPGERGQVAIRALKSEGRLIQCGKGRGKCLVIMSSEPIKIEQEEKEDLVAPEGAMASVPEMLRSIRNEFRNLEKLNNAKEKEILSLKTQIEEKDEKIALLESQVGMLNMATWQ